MADHKKPTNEELDAGMQKTLKELEEMDNDTQDDDIEDDAGDGDDKSDVDDDNKDDDAKDDKKDDDAGDDADKKDASNKEEDNKDDKKNNDDEDPEKKALKKNYADSTREAQILSAQRKKTNEAIDEAAKITDVPEEELRVEYPNWDKMDEIQQQLAKKTMINDKRFALINGVREVERDVEAWNKKVDDFIGDPQTLTTNPDLEGKEDEFKVFAGKETRRGGDFETLVSAFLHDYEKTKVKHKGAMFETGGGGDKKTHKREDGKLSFEDGQKLRKTDSKKYAELLKQDKIADASF